jgi:hypothetical protein
MSLQTYSQSLKLIDNDTLVCFSINQSKYLLKQVNSALFYQHVDSVNTEIIYQKDLLINAKNKEILKYKNINQLNDSLNHVCELKAAALTTYNNGLVRQVKKEKRAKILALFAGVVSTTVITTLYIIK